MRKGHCRCSTDPAPALTLQKLPRAPWPRFALTVGGRKHPWAQAELCSPTRWPQSLCFDTYQAHAQLFINKPGLSLPSKEHSLSLHPIRQNPGREGVLGPDQPELLPRLPLIPRASVSAASSRGAPPLHPREQRLPCFSPTTVRIANWRKARKDVIDHTVAPAMARVLGPKCPGAKREARVTAAPGRIWEGSEVIWEAESTRSN